MRPHVVIAAALTLASSAPTTARAQANEGDGEDGFVTPAREVSVGGARVADELGGATGYVMNEGVYVQGALGGFFRLGGFDVQRGTCPEVACVPVPTSDLQTAVALALGVDVTSWLAAQAQLGVGYVAGAAAYRERSADVPRDYALSFAELGVVARVDVIERLAATFTLGAGAAAVTPSPGVEQPWLGGSATAGAGLRWMSLLPSMSVGADVLWHGALFPSVNPDGSSGAPLVVHALSFAPVIKYVF